MGVAKQIILLMEVVAWGLFVGVAILTSPLSVGLSGGGMFPQPSVSGLGELPVVSIAAATGILVVAMVATEWLTP